MCDVLLILKLLDLYDHSTCWETRWWRESFHLFILTILSAYNTTLTPILIDLSALVEWSCMMDYGRRRNYADASDDVRANETRSPVRDDMYIVFYAVKSGEILFAARDEKAISFR